MGKPKQTPYGKGDFNRVTDKKNWDKEYERIFGKKKCSLNHKHTKECVNDECT